MNVDLGILGYLPLPQMPFDKVPTEKQRIVEESYKAIDKKQTNLSMKVFMLIIHTT